MAQPHFSDHDVMANKMSSSVGTSSALQTCLEALTRLLHCVIPIQWDIDVRIMEGLIIQIPVRGKRLTCALPSTFTTKEFSRALNVQVGKVVDPQNVFPGLLAYMLNGPDLQGYYLNIRAASPCS
ncbi:predicted protein [Histoplasma capsulatum G186AR]|uniref:Uncharacterized protein n=1 Tax=Ajellomyces capsulatus (strain G186AR / H82 / ATCC MYA-2454 / RMSCC 2432) TaxID=447093 RepID=C0NBU3_AJECG|nr:uncharacterized protein HCBG_00589 [Histoplasma capsulatum G186AR]EEH11134.1 predicted protein [Histoplasma capsulatum G186AR]